MTTGTEPGQPEKHNRLRWVWVAAVIAAVLVIAAVILIVQLRSDTAAPTTTATTTSAATSTPQSTTTATTTTTPIPAVGYQLLWPFANQDEVSAWQASYHQGGHQPWHLDAAMTAQSFTQGYLGYNTIDQISSVTTTGADAKVGVGYKSPNGTTTTAAVLHLVKIGSGTDVPWEVVGTEDTTLTLTTPAYGSTVSSPVTVGGRITGVDESLRVQVLHINDKAIGKTSGIPAGGQNTPWSTTVSFNAPAGSVLTIAVSTGGHVSDVERFAITGVRTARQ